METTSTRRRPRWGLLVLVIAVVAAGLAVRVVLADGGDSGDVSAAQVSSIRQACRGWMGTGPSGAAAHCDDMAGWMGDHMGANGMTPSMMWGDPERMRATCQQWMDDHPPADIAEPRAWCDDMVTWMTDHMSDWSGQEHWGGWMEHGPMMGGR